jgi:AGZA family xanthine/uracil permease-like MFS transporter
MFHLEEHGTTARREIRAGVTTFLTMSYIVAVNPLILAQAGMPAEGVMAATCLAAALGSVLMALLTNYPFALAPGMGLNAFFVYTVVLGMGVPWQGALAAVFLSGLLFLVLTVTRAREAVINSIPLSLKYAISVGIGFFIALIGLKNAGLIVFHPGTGSLGLVEAGYLTDPALQELLPPGTTARSIGVGLAGLAITTALVVRRVRGALLWGIVATTLLGLPLGVTGDGPGGIVSWPSGLGDTFLALDFSAVAAHGLLTVILTFAFVDLFDTTGTLVGLASKAGYLDNDGRLPKVRGALLADSLATTAGAVLGTSTTTTYIESASGIADGGRTGLTALTTAALFLLALFCAPLVGHVPAVATAPVLVVVGVFMMEPVTRIDFSDYGDAVPAFLTIAIMPLSFSISEGIVAGLLAYTFLAIVRRRRVRITLWVLSALFVGRYLFL